jgi:XTP/dITP diphosphohydrolase
MIDSVMILIASGNRGKLVEFQDILAGESFKLVLPADLGLRLEVEETGSTYAENATLKARAYAAASGLVTLADDSGLEVDALDGAPGLYSARYAPKAGATDADRREYLLAELARRGAPRPWLARFHCSAAVGTPAGEVVVVDGRCPGEIIAEERGGNGFGYDPIFYLARYERTMAELPAEIKNKISHRALAARAALPLLYRALGLAFDADGQALPG